MSILAALARAYDRLSVAGNMPRPGYSTQNTFGCIVLNADGSTQGSITPWGQDEAGRQITRRMNVPYFGGRSGKRPPPYFLWDNTAYVLGVTRKEKLDVGVRFRDFVALHEKALSCTDDEGILAVVRFLRNWRAEDAERLGLTEELIDRNLVFRLATESNFLHERPKAVAVWNAMNESDTTGEGICLVSGQRTQLARIHPPLVSFDNPARIVSFDKDSDAFASYGHVQGENAPIGVESAFAYSAALNRFLSKGSRNRIQIGDASTVFWADASGHVATEAELAFAQMFGSDAEAGALIGVDEAQQSKRVGEVLQRIRKGQPWLAAAGELMPDLVEGVRFFVLGLAPNAARISIRFWFEDDFGVLAENYRRFVEDMRVEPGPKAGRTPTLKRMLLRTAPARREPNGRIKFDQDRVPALLAGEFFRSILTGDRFPGMLLGQLLQRVRSDGLLDHLRVSLIKATIVRAMGLERRLPIDAQGKTKEDYLVRSDPNDPNDARRLGRLFALIERAQVAALGDEINSTVTDKFLGTCAATPQQVIPKLVLNAQEHHLKRLRNGHSDAKWITDSVHAKRVGAGLNRDIGQLYGSFENGFPAQHSNEEQGLFLVGYYQERYGRSSAGEDGAPPVDTDQDAADLGEE